MKYCDFLFLGLLLLWMCFTTCDLIDDRLVLVNKSDDRVYYSITEFENLEKVCDQKLADQGIKLTYRNYMRELAPDARRRQIELGSERAWEYFIEQRCENQRLHIYTFDIDTLKEYRWKEVVNGQRFRKKMSYSLADIEKMNWEVVLDDVR